MVASVPVGSRAFQAETACSRGAKSTKEKPEYSAQQAWSSSSTRWSWP